MRRARIAVVVWVVALTALAVSATALATGGFHFPSKSATGAIKWTTSEGGDGAAVFYAQPKGTGTGGTGAVAVKIDGVPNEAAFIGEVTCYSQTGNVARFSGPIRHGSATVSNGMENEGGVGAPATAFRITALDAGTPGSAGDKIRVQRTAVVEPCAAAPNAARPVTDGDIKIRGS